MPTPETLLTTVRVHWVTIYTLHWQLDASCREDAARNRKDNDSGNIAVLRPRALDMVRRDAPKISLSIKFKRVGWDDSLLRRFLTIYQCVMPKAIALSLFAQHTSYSLLPIDFERIVKA